MYLWPANLGGVTRLVVVSGESMEPTYDLGDIVVTRDRPTTAVGDVVVFEVPEGDEAAGMLVIHRALSVEPDGRFITQGDNRSTPDQWPLTEENIVGQPIFHIPRGAEALNLVRQPLVIAALAGVIAMLFLWPNSDDDELDDELDEDDLDDGVEPMPELLPETVLASAVATVHVSEASVDASAESDDDVDVWAAVWDLDVAATEAPLLADSTPLVPAIARAELDDDTDDTDADEADGADRDVADVGALDGETAVEVPAGDGGDELALSPDELAARWLDEMLADVSPSAPAAEVMADAEAWLDAQLDTAGATN